MDEVNVTGMTKASLYNGQSHHNAKSPLHNNQKSSQHNEQIDNLIPT